jgi:hypothetical protein
VGYLMSTLCSMISFLLFKTKKKSTMQKRFHVPLILASINLLIVLINYYIFFYHNYFSIAKIQKT